MNRLLLISLALAFAGGYADAGSYLSTGSFAGHVTGNTVLMMIHLSQGAGWAAWSNAAALAAFLAGTAAAEWLDLGSGTPARARHLRFPLLIEGALFAAALGLRWEGQWFSGDLSLVCLCLGLGIQNGALRKCGCMTVHTTFMTGISTTLLDATLKRATGKEKPDDAPKRPPLTLAGILLFFASGAGAGGWFDGHFKAWGLAGIFVPLAVALMAACLD